MTTTWTPEQVALAQRVLAHIEAYPEMWRQHTWRCETGMCFAGWAIELSGFSWVSNSGDVDNCDLVVVEPGQFENVLSPSQFLDIDRPDLEGKEIIAASNLAQQLLGLDPGEAAALFDGENTLNDLRTYVQQMVDGVPFEDEDGDE